MIGSARRASSTSSASNDGPGAIASGAGMAAGVDGEPAVRAGGASGRQHALRLAGEGHHLLRAGPEASGGQLVWVVFLIRRRLPGDDDEPALVLVVAEAQLADRPLGLARLLGRRL